MTAHSQRRRAATGGARLAAAKLSDESFFSPGENGSGDVLDTHDGYITEPSVAIAGSSTAKSKALPRKSSMFKRLAGLFRTENTTSSPTSSMTSQTSTASQSSVLHTPFDTEFGQVHSGTYSGVEVGRQTPQRRRLREEEEPLGTPPRISCDAVYPPRTSSKHHFHPNSPTALTSTPHLPSTCSKVSALNSSRAFSSARPAIFRTRSSQSLEQRQASAVASRQQNSGNGRPVMQRSQSNLSVVVSQRRSKEEKRRMDMSMPMPNSMPCSPISPVSPVAWSSNMTATRKAPTSVNPNLDTVPASPRYPPELIAELSAGLEPPIGSPWEGMPGPSIGSVVATGSAPNSPRLQTRPYPPSSPPQTAPKTPDRASLAVASKKRPPISESPKVPLPPLPLTPSPLQSTFGTLSAPRSPTPTSPRSPHSPRSRSPGIPTSPHVLYSTTPKSAVKKEAGASRTAGEDSDAESVFGTPRPRKLTVATDSDRSRTPSPLPPRKSPAPSQSRPGSSGKTRPRPTPLTIQPLVQNSKILISKESKDDLKDSAESTDSKVSRLQDAPSDPPSPVMPLISPAHDELSQHLATDSPSDSDSEPPASCTKHFGDAIPNVPESMYELAPIPSFYCSTDPDLDLYTVTVSSPSPTKRSPPSPAFSSPERSPIPPAMASSPTLPRTPGEPRIPRDPLLKPLRDPFKDLRWRTELLKENIDDDDDGAWTNRPVTCTPTRESTPSPVVFAPPSPSGSSEGSVRGRGSGSGQSRYSRTSQGTASSLPPLRDPFKDLMWRTTNMMDDVEYDPFLLLEKLALRIPTAITRRPSTTSTLASRRPKLAKAKTVPFLDEEFATPSLSVSPSPATPTTPLTPITPTSTATFHPLPHSAPAPSSGRARANTSSVLPRPKFDAEQMPTTMKIKMTMASPVIIKATNGSSESSLESCKLPYLSDV